MGKLIESVTIDQRVRCDRFSGPEGLFRWCLDAPAGLLMLRLVRLYPRPDPEPWANGALRARGRETRLCVDGGRFLFKKEMFSY